MAREFAKTEAYRTSRRQCKKVEMLFAHLKRILKLDRLRLRGPNGARDEFHLAATAQNLRKLDRPAIRATMITSNQTSSTESGDVVEKWPGRRAIISHHGTSSHQPPPAVESCKDPFCQWQPFWFLVPASPS
jgi:hypothetical protein